MAQILIKRGTQALVDAATLLPGELCLATDTGNLYVGTATGKALVNPPVAEDAAKLKTARSISVTGDGAWSVSFDGSADVTGELTLADSGVTAGEYGNLTVDKKGRVTAARAATLADISDAGSAAALTAGTAKGNVPVIGDDGKLATSIIPSLALTDTYVVADEAAMLALQAEQGDIAIRSDEGKTYILVSGDPTDKTNWVWLRTPESPVSSVAGRTGDIVLTKDDVGLANVDNTADADKAVLSASKLTTARTLKVTGAVTMADAISFDGTANVELPVTAVDASKLTGVIDGGELQGGAPEPDAT